MFCFECTVVPVMNGHPRDQAKVSVHCRWPLIRGTDGHVNCVGTLITCPYTAGGRSRRGSLKAGTTVCKVVIVRVLWLCIFEFGIKFQFCK